MQVLFDGPDLLVIEDEAVPCLQISWRQRVTDASFRWHLDHYLSLWEERQRERPGTPLRGIVSDSRSLPGLSASTMAWAATDWMPRAVAAGLPRIAYVWPEQQAGRLSMIGRQLLMARMPADARLETAIFADLAQAKAWLRHGNTPLPALS